ncbi:hypothetical protein BDV59DRAFT_190057 [Aspergillus ambiguus]|uniref:putative C6 transcription factor n=1 Tax=Aspergillus ambiguus TaxID=176160 RepID=UPI003CCCDA42
MTHRDSDFRHQLGKFRLDTLPSPAPTAPPAPPPPVTSVLSSPSNTTTAHARTKRVSTACDFCRKRKKKCDFRYPNCSACTRAGVRCTIPPPGPQVASASVPRDQLENLQNRVRWLEEVVRRKTGIAVADRPTGTPLEGEGDPDWWYQVPTLMMARDPLNRTATTGGGVTSSPSTSSPAAMGPELPNVGEIFRDQLEHRRPSVARPVASAPRVLRLASLAEAERVAAQYFDSMGYQYPFLHRGEFFAHLRSLYTSDGVVGAPEVHYTYHITIAIALLIGSSDGVQAIEFYRASQETLPSALQNEDLAAVRALLSLALYTMFATSGPSVWHVLGTALRLATSLGLHKARPTASLVEEEMAKRAFWSLYNLDRLIASTLGRPLGIADEDITVTLPREFNEDWTEAPGSSSMTIPVQVVRLRRIFSRIYRYLYNNQPPPPSSEVTVALRQFRQELDDWRRAAPVYPPALLYSTSYYDYLFATTLLLMYRPSPRNPMPDALSIVSCGDASIQVIRSYWDSYSVGKLKWIWLTLSQIYFAGITILWCLHQNLRAMQDGQAPVWQPDDQTMRRGIQAVVVLLEEFGKRRPGVERLAETFRQQSTTIFSNLPEPPAQSQPPAPSPLSQPPSQSQPHVLVAPPVPLAPVLDDVLLVDGSGNIPVMDPSMAEQLFYSCTWRFTPHAIYLINLISASPSPSLPSPIMAPSTPAHAFYGTLIHSLNPSTIEYLPDTLIVINEHGTIEALHPHTPKSAIPSLTSHPITFLPPSEFLIPGFIDTHIHAPQWSQRGVGRGIPLLHWLEGVTFAHEARCSDDAHARRLFHACVTGGLKQGVTTACYYSSRHASATVILAETCLALGQRALLGKCNMDRNAVAWYVDGSAAESVADTEAVIGAVRALDAGRMLVTPVITPRFAISCSPALLRGLGELAARPAYRTLPIQTHFNESRQEMAFTRELFPGVEDETALYEAFGLLGPRTVLAHAVYLSPREMDRVQALGCGIAHCPVPNTTMDEFMVAPVREYLARGVKVGLGTDCGGGFSSSMLEVMRMAFMVSVARETQTGGRDKPLSLAEGFYLATAGGARVCGLEETVGRFAVGMQFDAVLVRTGEGVDGVMTPVEEEDSLQTVFEKFLMTGDDRNMVRVFVKGRDVKGEGGF